MSNRKCLTCGTEYSYCPTCERDKNKEIWHIMFDCKNCKDIFDTLTNYYLKKINKSVAKDILDALDLDKKHMFNKNMQKQIEEILFIEKEIEPIEESTTNPEQVVVDIDFSIVEENTVDILPATMDLVPVDGELIEQVRKKPKKRK